MNKASGVSQDVALRQKLARDVETVLDAIQDLHNSGYVFRKFLYLRNGDPRLLIPSPFTEWLIENYVHSTAVGVRKQIKPSGISMRCVLDSLERNPRVVSRQNFVEF